MEVAVKALDFSSPTAMLFLSPTCRFCRPIVSALPRVRVAYPEVEIVPIVVGEDEEAKVRFLTEHGLDARVDLDDLFADWSIPGTPFAVGVGTDRRIVTSGIVNTLPQLETFAQTILHRTRVGEDAHESSASSAGGKLVPLGKPVE
ncbi:MAG: hypothetical protein ACRDI0_08450 [Actinomycetota bacterium]